MRRNDKIISGTLIAALIVSVFGNLNLPVHAQEISEEKQYIIVMENNQIYDEVAEEVSDSITVETPVLSENNVIVAELTEGEAANLEYNDGVIIEEDIMISASTAEDNEDETQESIIAEARQSKEEVKQSKQELLAEPKENEEVEKEAEPEYEWNLQEINVEEVAEGQEQNQQKVKVAVLDSGVETAHKLQR